MYKGVEVMDKSRQGNRRNGGHVGIKVWKIWKKSYSEIKEKLEVCV